MRARGLAVCAMALVLACVGCERGNDEQPAEAAPTPGAAEVAAPAEEMPAETADPGAGANPEIVPTLHDGELEFRVLPAAPDEGSGETAPVLLEGPTAPIDRIKSYRDGSTIFFGTEGAAFTPFGQSAYRKMIWKGEAAELNSFGEQGAGWTCVVDDVLYREVDGTAVPIGLLELRTYRTASGEERRAGMTRRTGEDTPWCFEAEGGEVLCQAEGGELRRIGRMGFRLATLPSGERIVIMMSKANGDRARWSGRHAGRLYVEP